MIKELSVILGNQLCNPKEMTPILKHPVFMCESDDLCTHFKYHQSKIIFFLTAMRTYKDELASQGVNCWYHELSPSKSQVFEDVLDAFCKEHSVETIHMIEIEDHFFEKSMRQFCKKRKIQIHFYDSPLFLNTREEFSTYLQGSKKPFQKTFYEQQRKKRAILMQDDKPEGGQFSFDEENRKKTPKKIDFPEFKLGTSSKHLEPVSTLVRQKFSDHIGAEGELWFPCSRDEVSQWCDHFIATRLTLFGDYEDAIDTRSDFLFHSVLSPFINVGLISPKDILAKVTALQHKVPLNSLEGFIRQVMGWREFIRGIYHEFDEVMQTDNFFNHQGRLTKDWYEGTTGIPPLDDAIQQVMRLGYTHHINRLMVIGNVMLLCRLHPQEVYKWFMECFIDSSDWVMSPNVFGMSQFSEGGIFATKPYLCGSNYIRKMSHYPKGDWCDTMDALYWRFIIDHEDFFKQNYRMRMMVSKAASFTKEKTDQIVSLSDAFIQKVTK